MKPEFQWTQSIIEPGSITELRILNTRKGTVSGYFNDLEKLATVATSWSGKAPAVYFMPNPINPQLLARSTNHVTEYAKSATNDADILKYRWLLIDFDPRRPAGISSSEAEHLLALEKAQACHDWIHQFGFSDPIFADSGNGAHLNYLIDLPNEKASTELVSKCLQAVAFHFNNEHVEVDTKNFNPARIWKLYGTMACKGDSTPDRPHRMSKIIELPNLQIATREQLEFLAKSLPHPQTHKTRLTSSSLDSFKIDQFVQAHFPAAQEETWVNGKKWVLNPCPFNSNHTNKSAFIVEFSSGALAAGCHHNSCTWGWKELREKYEPRKFTKDKPANPAAEPPKAIPALSNAPMECCMGVYTGSSHYFKLGEAFTEKPISNFLMKPVCRVWLDGKENLEVEFLNGKKKYPPTTIPREAWNTIDRFKDLLPSVDLAWYGRVNDIEAVRSILASYPNIPVKEGVSTLGLHEDVWITPKGVFTKDGFVENHKLVYLPRQGRGELDSKISISKASDKTTSETIKTLYQNIIYINQPQVTIPAIGWFCASFFKPMFVKRVGAFPLLSLWGTRGSGKTSLLRLLWRLCGVGNEQVSLFSCTETDFVLLRLLSATTSIPVVFDEYKPSDMPELKQKSLVRFLRRVYDGDHELRGRSNLTSVDYNLAAPVAIAGEVPLTDGALLERIISVEMSPNSITESVKNRYKIVNKLPLASFADALIPFSLNIDFEAEYERAQQLTSRIKGFDSLANRIQNNLIAIIFGFQQFLRFGVKCDDSLNLPELEQLMLDSICHTGNAIVQSNGGSKVALDYLVETLAVMADRQILIEGQDFVIRPRLNDIALRFSNCLPTFKKFARETQYGGEILDETAYRKQAAENYDRGGYVLSTKEKVRFDHGVKNAIVINPLKCGEAGVDVDGFISGEEIPNLLPQ